MRSLRNKITALEAFLSSCNQHTPAVVGITESWLRTHETEFIKLPGYICADHFCRSNTSGGGVIVFVRSDIKFKKCHQFNKFQVEGDFEFCVIYVQLFNAYILTIYRPQKGI